MRLTIEDIARGLAKLDGWDYDVAPYHKQITWLCKVRHFVRALQIARQLKAAQ